MGMPFGWLGRLEEIEAATRAKLDGLPEFRPIEDWRQDFTDRLDGRADG